MRTRNWLLFSVMAFLWGSNWPVMKVGLSYVPAIRFVLHRFVLSTIALSPIFIVMRKKIPKDGWSLLKLLVLSIINVLGVVMTNIGLVGESSGIGAVLTYTQPLFVFCLAVPFLKEAATPIKVLGTVIGFLGVTVLSLDRIGSFTFNSTFTMILGAFLWAVTVIYYKKLLSQVDPLITSFFQLSMGTIPLAALSFATGGIAIPRDLNYLLILLYTSVGASAIGWTLWLLLLREEDAIVLSGSSFIVPMIALIFGWLILGEEIQVRSIVGSALILVGVYLVNLQARRRR